MGCIPAEIRYPGASGIQKLIYDPSVMSVGIGIDVVTVILQATDPASTGPFGIPLATLIPIPMQPTAIQLPQTFILSIGGASAFSMTVLSLDTDTWMPGMGINVNFGPQALPLNTHDVAGEFTPCLLIAGGANCPRIDAWIDGNWVEVGRAIKNNRGVQQDGVHLIVLKQPASRFRIVEDEPEMSHVHYILGDGRPWNLGPLITMPGDEREFIFGGPVQVLETRGYYEPVPEPGRSPY